MEMVLFDISCLFPITRTLLKFHLSPSAFGLNKLWPVHIALSVSITEHRHHLSHLRKIQTAIAC